MPRLNKVRDFFRVSVPAHEKEQLRQMEAQSTAQHEEARDLLHEARSTGAKLAASRQRNHYRLLLDEILGGRT